MRLFRSSLVVACTLVAAGCNEKPANGAPAIGGPMTVEVDATDAAHGRIHTHVVVPAHAGTHDHKSWGAVSMDSRVRGNDGSGATLLQDIALGFQPWRPDKAARLFGTKTCVDLRYHSP